MRVMSDSMRGTNELRMNEKPKILAMASAFGPTVRAQLLRGHLHSLRSKLTTTHQSPATLLL